MATARPVPRWVGTWKTLPEPIRRRLVLEHDDVRFSAADVLWIHEHTGVRLVFDHQHFWCLNPDRIDLRGTLARMQKTWPGRVRPKVHVSSPRTELREVRRKPRGGVRSATAYVAPVWTGHADFVHPFEFITFMRQAAGLDFDVMLEAKPTDLALVRLRADLLRYAPDVAARFGLRAEQAGALEGEASVLVDAAAGGPAWPPDPGYRRTTDRSTARTLLRPPRRHAVCPAWLAISAAAWNWCVAERF